jgi:hypothetical protein
VPAPLLLLRIVFYDLGRLAAFAAWVLSQACAWLCWRRGSGDGRGYLKVDETKDAATGVSALQSKAEAEAAAAATEAEAAGKAAAEAAEAEEAAAALIPMARPPLTIADAAKQARYTWSEEGQPGTARLCARRREPA